MAVEKQYLSDVEAILSHRYDNGGDLWATPDKRLLKGAPFSTLENILLLLEVGMELSEPLLKEAIDLIFSTWQKDGRFKIYPQGGIYPCHTAHAADTLCHMGYVSDARLKKLSGTFWIFNMSMAAGAAISSVLAGARKQIIQTPSQHLPFRVHSALVTISTKNRRLIERWISCLSIGQSESFCAKCHRSPMHEFMEDSITIFTFPLPKILYAIFAEPILISFLYVYIVVI